MLNYIPSLLFVNYHKNLQTIHKNFYYFLLYKSIHKSNHNDIYNILNYYLSDSDLINYEINICLTYLSSYFFDKNCREIYLFIL